MIVDSNTVTLIGSEYLSVCLQESALVSFIIENSGLKSWILNLESWSMISDSWQDSYPISPQHSHRSALLWSCGVYQCQDPHTLRDRLWSLEFGVVAQCFLARPAKRNEVDDKKKMKKIMTTTAIGGIMICLSVFVSSFWLADSLSVYLSVCLSGWNIAASQLLGYGVRSMFEDFTVTISRTHGCPGIC